MTMVIALTQEYRAARTAYYAARIDRDRAKGALAAAMAADVGVSVGALIERPKFSGGVQAYIVSGFDVELRDDSAELIVRGKKARKDGRPYRNSVSRQLWGFEPAWIVEQEATP